MIKSLAKGFWGRLNVSERLCQWVQTGWEEMNDWSGGETKALPLFFPPLPIAPSCKAPLEESEEHSDVMRGLMAALAL